MKTLKKEKADYTLKVKSSTGKQVRQIAYERSITVDEVIRILLAKMLNQKV